MYSQETSPALSIAEMHVSQVGPVAEIEAQISQKPWSEKLFADEFTLRPESRLWLVAEDNKTVVGYGGAMLLPGEAHILNLGVKAEMMRQGVGSYILGNLLQRIEQSGSVKVVHLEVRETNVAALSLYEKFDFIEVGKRKDYYGKGAHALLLTKMAIA